MERRYRVFGACSCWGAQIKACEKGPEDLVQGHVFEELKRAGVPIEGPEMLYPLEKAADLDLPASRTLPLICELSARLAHAVEKAVSAGLFPVVIGGDHTNGVGTWGGVRQAMLKKGPLPMALLWFDAHMDAHTPETTPSGAWHGMPVAALLGRGDPRMAQLTMKDPVLLPQHVALIGVRSYEEGEAKLLEKLRVRVYFIDEVKRRGLKVVVHEALERITKGCCGFGVSLDLDMIDPEEAPGVGSPERDGVSSSELLPTFSMLGKDPRLLGLELVEFNPERDVEHKTRRLILNLLKEIL